MTAPSSRTLILGDTARTDYNGPPVSNLAPGGTAARTADNTAAGSTFAPSSAVTGVTGIFTNLYQRQVTLDSRAAAQVQRRANIKTRLAALESPHGL